MSRVSELAICFADVCDSTALFEKHGDDRSREVVGRTLDLVSEVIEDHSGTVVKTIGDEVMGTFPELVEATSAVAQMPQVVKQDENLASFGIRIRVGMCYGSVVKEENGDVFGDAVNTAARLVDWARANQVVTTADTLRTLPDYFQGRTRNLGHTSLRGKEEPVEIIELLGEQNQSSLTVVIDDATSTSAQEEKNVLVLFYEGEEIAIEQGPLVLGRGEESDLPIPDSRVSRVHAVVEQKRDSFVITDSSTNGTYVQIGNEDVVFLHHEELRLHGKGQIGLGRPVEDQDGRLLYFECKSIAPDESTVGPTRP